MSGSATTGARDVGAVAREAWATRPARRDADRKIAGVAGAIARRYAVDPTLVRVVMVVLALSGGGLLLYLAGWVTLPPDPADPPRRDRRRDGGTRSGPPTALVVVAVVVAFATLGPVFGGRLQGLVGLAVAAVLLYGLHTGRAHLGVVGPGAGRVTGGPDAGTAGPSDAATTTTGQAGQASDPDATSVPPPPQPPRWDPLGAAPFAWDLPEPSTPPPPPTPRSKVTPVTLALALLAAGATGVLAITGVGGIGIGTVFAAALAVVGLGLVAAAFRHTGRGLIIAAVPLVLLTVVTAAAGSLTSRFGDGDPGGPVRGVGDVRAAPVAAALVAPSYRTGLGDVDLDLRGIPAGPVPVRTQIESGAGDLTVRVPEDADVTVSCRSGVGDVDCLGRDGEVTGLVDLGRDGPGGPVVDLTLQSGAGDVEVRRG